MRSSIQTAKQTEHPSATRTLRLPGRGFGEVAPTAALNETLLTDSSLKAAHTFEPLQFKGKNKKKFRGMRMSLAEFHAAHDRPWTRWNSQTEASEQVTGVPSSSVGIPEELEHITHYSALPSIRNSGLDPNFRNAGTGLNAQSGTSKYSKRDGSLNAVYLGTTPGVGGSMADQDKAKEGGTATLIARVPAKFRYQHMRAASSVISDDAGTFQNNKVGNTALSFEKIPPRYLFLKHATTGKLMPLRSLQPNKQGEHDFRPYVTAPAKGRDPLHSNQKLIETRERLRKMVSESQRSPVEYPPVSPVQKIEPEIPAIHLENNEMFKRAQALSAKAELKSDSEDSDWD